MDGGQLLNVSPVRAREPDEVCAQAVDLARGAAEELAGAAAVGEHLGVEADGDRVVTHLFACLDRPGTGAGAGRSPWPGRRGPRTSPWTRSCWCPARTPSSRRRGFPGGNGCGRATWASGTSCPRPPTTSGWCRRGLEGDDGMEDLTTIASQLAVLAERRWPPRPRPRCRSRAARAVRDRPRRRGAALVHRRARAAEPAGPRGARAVLQLRVLRPAGRPAGAGVRGVREQLRAGRRPGGLGRSRLRRRTRRRCRPPGADRPLRPVIDELGYDLVDMPGVSVEETVFEPLERGRPG